jgi:membrane fusion protein, multidrug efflux system
MSILSYVAAIGFSPTGLDHPPSKKVLKRTAAGIALVAGLAAAANLGHDYWKVGRFLQSTTNAYIRADYTVVSPKITGHIIEVLVQDNEPVTAGQVVARVDDRDFRVALAQAKADVASDDAELGNLDARIAQQQSAIDQEKAEIAAGKASLSYAEADNVRYANLKKSGYGTVQRAEKAETALRQKTAQLQKNRAGLLMAQRKIDMLASERAKAQAQRDRSLAAVHQAELNLSYTSITTAVPGVVGARSLRVGQYVQAGTPLMAVVPLDAVYIVANYKETQLTHVRTGQLVEIEVDSFPGITLKGHVDSVSPASGLEFALLPSNNATGNFTKIVQRVPVKIVLDDKTLAGSLRPGMSVEATIDTRARN